jgi:beta-glucosidase-like glycosyl hydrolase/CubicO group peptidase (beta-lactamase class C family)
MALTSCAAVADPVAPVLAGMDLEQKAGQLFVAWSLSRPDGDNHERLLAAVRDAGLGGVILSLGTVDDAASLIPQLQAAAAVPLLLASDFEGGVWHRLDGATELGRQMLVGATGSAELAEAMGRVTARQAKALGFHWVFAPVLDVNSNPDNPIINVRSFGEDPRLVARLGGAFARGVRSQGLLPCGKHFPGHGDVDSDSHLALPTVPGDGERLRRVELLPFAAAAQDGLESIMTGHLAVPGLGEAADVPATLSHHILTDVLRGELGFTGLVVTDALEMGGVKDAFPPGEVAVRALLAGADVLLMPPDPLVARAAVVAAVRSGRVPLARLDDAVGRILAAKAKVGLLDGGGRVAPDWRAQMRTPAAERVADAIARRGLTLVFARGQVLPLRGDDTGRPLLVTLLDRDEGQLAVFGDALGIGPEDRVRLAGDSTAEHVAAAAQRVAAATRIVLALDVRVREYSGAFGLPPRLQPVVAALRQEQRVVAVSFGDPYVARQLPAADAYLCAYAGTDRMQRFAAEALRGERAITGRLPVTIPGVARLGEGCTELPGTEVPRAAPADQDLDAGLPERIRALLERAVADRAFPGGVCRVARRGQLVADVAVGRVGYDEGADAVTADTVYDLASLTKVTATLPAVLRLAARGSLSLDDAVQKWLPAFTGAGRQPVTVRDLLLHRSGLPAWRPFFRTLRTREAIVAAAAAEPMTDHGSVRYSDLGFLLLGAIVEAASGESLAAFAQREVFAPLCMARARFAPTEEPPLAAAPTENGTTRGHVHDENARAMGGIAGHAGLFATADDVLRFGITMLAGGRGVLPRDLVAQATRAEAGGERGLGFACAADGTFSHTGFTGTSVWCDPRHDLCVVLLSNRVHPSRDNGKITAVRRDLHTLVLDSLR